ncbi:hypothetical protein Tco_0934900 [Tanacetum coccineum]
MFKEDVFIEMSNEACIYGAFMSVDTYDILTNNEFLIFDIWEKIFTEDDAWVGVILVNGGYGDATNDIYDVWNVALIRNVLFNRCVEKLKFNPGSSVKVRFNPGSSVKVRFNPGSSKLKLILVLLGVEKGDARSTWTWKRKCQLSLANWMQFGCFLLKPTESAGYTEIVDFLRRSKLRYALTHNPPIYDSLVKQFWQTATARTLAIGFQQLVSERVALDI